GDVAVPENVVKLEQHLAAVRGEATGEAHHGAEDALQVLEPLLREEELHRHHAGEPVSALALDEGAPAYRGDLGADEARHQLAYRPRVGDDVRVHRNDDLRAGRADRAV